MEKDRNDKNIGKKLDGRYEITELIGEGGMADVYRATDVVDNKTVAVKILKKEFAENEEFLRRFRNESKAIAVLSHPNIVKIYDVGFSERIQFIVMEYIDGITLNRDHNLETVKHSIGIVTALNPVIGYKASTKIAKEALETGRSVYNLVLEHGLLQKEQLDELLDPKNMLAAH